MARKNNRPSMSDKVAKTHKGRNERRKMKISARGRGQFDALPPGKRSKALRALQ